MRNLNFKIRVAVVAGAMTIFPFMPAQAGTLFAIDDSGDQLLKIDTDSFAIASIGPLGTNFFAGGLAYNPNSAVLYMIGGVGNANLYTVNTSTGAASLVGNHGLQNLLGLAYDSTNNQLYASQGGSGFSGLFTLDINTGSATTVNASMTVDIGGLSYDLTNDRLVGIWDGGSAGVLFDIDRMTGAQTQLFDGPGTNNSGLAYDPDKDLFWDADLSRRLASYDPNNGFVQTLHLSGPPTPNLDGLAYLHTRQQVSEPTTLAILGLGLAGLCFARRRKTV